MGPKECFAGAINYWKLFGGTPEIAPHLPGGLHRKLAQAEAPRLRRNPHDPQNSSINHTLSRQSRATLIEYPNRSPQTWTHLGEVLILEKKHTSTAQPAVDLIDEKNVRARTALAEARHAAYTLLFYDVLGEVRTEENELPLPDQFGAWMELMELLNDGDMAVEMQFDFSGKSRDRTEMPYAIAKGVELIKQMGDSSPLFRGRQISEADVWWILAKTMGRLGKQGSKNPALSAEMQVKIDAIAEAHVDDPPAFCLDYSLHIFGALNPHSETLCSISFGAFLGFVEHLHTTVADDVRDGDILHEVLPDLQKIVEVLATKDGVEKSIGPFVWLVLGWKGNSDDVAVKAHYIYAEHLAILKKLDPNGNAPFVELLQLDSAKKIWQPLVHRRIIDGKGPPPFEFPEIPEQGPPLELVPGLHPQTAITIARGWWTASFTAAVVAGHPHSSSGVSSDEAFRVALDVLSAYVSDDLDIRKVLVEFLDEFTPLTVDDKSVYGKYDCLLRRLAVCRGNSAISWLELGKRGGVNFKGKPYTPQQSFVEAIQKCPNVHDSEGFSAWKGLLDTMPGGAAPASPGGYK